MSARTTSVAAFCADVSSAGLVLAQKVLTAEAEAEAGGKLADAKRLGDLDAAIARLRVQAAVVRNKAEGCEL